MNKLILVVVALTFAATSVILSTGVEAQIVLPVDPNSAFDAPSVSADVVISQVYGGAGTAGATYNRDYIELFNRGNSSVSLVGKSVQYASTAGSTWQVTPLTGSIQPGQHFLIQENSGIGTNSIPTPDVSGSISMAQANGKVALVSNTTPLTCGATNNCTGVATVIDFVGYGTASSYEGAGAAPALSTITAALRSGNGCIDTDSNIADFTSVSPNPRNTASPLTGCTNSTSPTGYGVATPNTLNAGDAVLLTVPVTPGTNPSSTGLAVVTDLTNIGGTGNQFFYDDGTNGDVTPGDNTFSFATNIGAGTPAGIKILAFTVSDAQDRSSNGNIQLTVQGTSNPSGSGSASPASVAPGGSALLTFNVVPGTVPTSTGIAVTANLASIGGSSSQAFTDNGSNNFSFSATVAAGTTDGLKTFPVTITDAQSRTGSGSISLTVQANVSHTPAEHELMGNPTAAGATNNNDWLIERNQYVLSYNCAKGIPNWVEWHIDASWLGPAQRTDNYRPQTDIPLPSGCYVVQGSDYSGNVNNGGFDRGHNTPSGDRTNTVSDNDSTFIMTNFIPQAPQNNQGIWNDMENYIRSQVTAGNEIYTWMGNAGQGGIGLNGFATTVANGHVVVPAYVWRVVMVLPLGSNDLSRVDANTRVFAVLTPNIQSANGLNSNWMTYICPVSKIEQLTGMNFFQNVPPATANILKQKIDPSLAAQTIGSGTMTNLTIAYPLTYMTGNVTVTGTLALGPESLVTTNVFGTTNYTITLGPNATVTRLNSGMVNGTMERQFTSSSTGFTYPVGTNDGYSPVTVNPTAVAVNPSSIAVTPHNVAHPSSPDPANTLKRYWTLTETGDITANLLFKYVDTDVPVGVTESSLALHRYESSFALVNGAVLDTSANTVATTTPVSIFSDWTLMRPMAPASDLTVSGRVTIPRAGGTGVRSAIVKFVDQQTLAERTVVTDATGHYLLDNVTSGTTFVVTVTARGLTFEPRTIPVSTSLANQDFIGSRPSNRDF
jgi:endonuclease G